MLKHIMHWLYLVVSSEQLIFSFVWVCLCWVCVWGVVILRFLLQILLGTLKFTKKLCHNTHALIFYGYKGVHLAYKGMVEGLN